MPTKSDAETAIIKPVTPVRFVFLNRTVDATAVLDERGFTVFAGSQASANRGLITTKGYGLTLDRLLRDGTLIPDVRNPKRLIFTADVTFRNTSEATTILNGRQSSGPAEWAAPDGSQPPKLNQLRQNISARYKGIATDLRKIIKGLEGVPDAGPWLDHLEALATMADRREMPRCP